MYRRIYRRIISINNVHAYFEQCGASLLVPWNENAISPLQTIYAFLRIKNKNNNNLHLYRTLTFMVIV